MRKLFKERKLIKRGNYMRKYGMLLSKWSGLITLKKKVQISETILATKVRTVVGKSCLFVTFSIDIII